MKDLATAVEDAWLWTYTAGLAPAAADDRRAEIASDHWEHFAHHSGRPPTSERLRRLAVGIPDDIAWRAAFGRKGLSKVRSHEFLLVVAIASLVFVSLPASAWWIATLTGNPSQPHLQIWYIGTEAIALACTVVGGAAAAADYPKTGRALMLAGAIGLVATLWWTPILAGMMLLAAIVVVLSLPSRPASLLN